MIYSSLAFDYNFLATKDNLKKITWLEMNLLLSNLSANSPYGRIMTLINTDNKYLSKEQIGLKSKWKIKMATKVSGDLSLFKPTIKKKKVKNDK